jgi:diamine N-acetyltransferase
MIELRPIRAEDITDIKSWPPYRGGFEQMDYALRDNGWLEEFRDRPNTVIYIAETAGTIIGFSLLSVIVEEDAEFRIAMHPDWTGRGLGRDVTLATLETGFRHLNLARVHLIVRKNNPRASKLYRSIGFAITGESVHTIQGNAIECIDMVMTRERFHDFTTEEIA